MDSLSRNPIFWLIYFTIAFGMGFWNYRKGHSLMIGFFISLLMTPLTGLLFNIFAPPNKEVLRRREASAPIPCPSCGHKNPPKTFKCEKCGERMKKKL